MSSITLSEWLWLDSKIHLSLRKTRLRCIPLLTLMIMINTWLIQSTELRKIRRSKGWPMLWVGLASRPSGLRMSRVELIRLVWVGNSMRIWFRLSWPFRSLIGLTGRFRSSIWDSFWILPTMREGKRGWLKGLRKDWIVILLFRMECLKKSFSMRITSNLIWRSKISLLLRIVFRLPKRKY